MFKCDVCGCSGKGVGRMNHDNESSKMMPGVKMKRVVTKYRIKKYKLSNRKISTGMEIAKELRVCPECYEKLNNSIPKYKED